MCSDLFYLFSFSFLVQLSPECQAIVAEYNSLAEHDIDELADNMAAAFKAKSKEIWRKRSSEMLSKIMSLKDKPYYAPQTKLSTQLSNLSIQVATPPVTTPPPGASFLPFPNDMCVFILVCLCLVKQ